MDYIQKSQKLPVDAKFNKYHFLRRTLQVVLSVSILSLFFCYSHDVSFFPHSFSVYFSTFLFSLFTHTLERKYIFLICNGILAFLAKTSASANCDVDEMKVSATKAAPLVAKDQVVSFVNEGGEEEKETREDEEVAEEDESHDEEGKSFEDLSSSTTTTTTLADHKNENEEEDQESGGEFSSNKQREANEDELISTDELNRKIEEFIRKMKEEIRIEAQQQLIAV